MAHNRSKMWKHKSASLKSLYGVEEGDNTPLSYRQYLIKMLNRSTWGEDVVLHALSCLFRMKITVVNAVRLDEARYQHTLPLAACDMVLIYNGHNHYTFAG